MIELFHCGLSLTTTQKKAICTAAETALAHERVKGDIAIHIIGKKRMRELNCAYRGMDCVTDVLSFPTGEAAFANTADGFLGDILICLARAKAQAAEYGQTDTQELAFLAIHGSLHLLGYDHMTEEEEAIMFKKQKEIRFKVERL